MTAKWDIFDPYLKMEMLTNPTGYEKHLICLLKRAESFIIKERPGETSPDM